VTVIDSFGLESDPDMAATQAGSPPAAERLAAPGLAAGQATQAARAAGPGRAAGPLDDWALWAFVSEIPGPAVPRCNDM
jgi:hypothetical protein